MVYHGDTLKAISKTDRDLSLWSIFRKKSRGTSIERGTFFIKYSVNFDGERITSSIPSNRNNRSTKVKFRAKISSEISLLLIKKFFDLSSVLNLPDIQNVNIRYDVPTLIACPRRV